MDITGKKWSLFLASSILAMSTFSQTPSTDLTKINTITTALPFLRIANDTRSGGMADVGIATPSDANGAQLNGAKMAFNEKDFGVGLSFTPWLKSLVNDIYLASLTGYGKFGKGQNVIHGQLRYFSLGQINFTNDVGDNIGDSRPQEIAVDFGYSRKLYKTVSIGVTLRFAYSRLANGMVNGQQINPALAGAGDISLLWRNNYPIKNSRMSVEPSFGFCFSNLGNKVSYTSAITKDYIPANMGLGAGLNVNLTTDHSVGFYLDVNKLLVPTPVPSDQLYEGTGTAKKVKAIYDKNNDGIADYRQAPINGIFSSFNDAPGGTKEELKEITTQIGLEYMYKKMFGVRSGFFYEDPTKGNRQFVTVGATVKYSVATLHLSYLIPTSNQRNPLDNTFRLSFSFDFAKGNKKKVVDPAAGVSLETPAPAKIKTKKGNFTPESIDAPKDGTISPDVAPK